MFYRARSLWAKWKQTRGLKMAYLYTATRLFFVFSLFLQKMLSEGVNMDDIGRSNVRLIGFVCL